MRLRNIDISGVGSGNVGISILAASAVILEDIEITGNVKQGISDTRTEAMGSTLTIKNTVVANNAGSGIAANAQVEHPGARQRAIDQECLWSCAWQRPIPRRSPVRCSPNNTTAGIEVDSGGQMMLDSSVVSYNVTGISANGGAVGFTNSDIAFNGTAITGATTTFGNSRIFGNGAAGMAPVARRRCCSRARSAVTRGGSKVSKRKGAAGLLPPRPFLYLAGPGAETPVAKLEEA